jgi:hypothetical protein
MERKKVCQSFVTDKRVREAVRYADGLAFDDPSLAAHACAEAAVREVFGQWLMHADGTLRADRLPLYFQLSNRVESKLGLHRGFRVAGRKVVAPAPDPLSGLAFVNPDEFVGATAITI